MAGVFSRAVGGDAVKGGPFSDEAVVIPAKKETVPRRLKPGWFLGYYVRAEQAAEKLQVRGEI
jgi:hypothetical protein